MKYQKSAQIKKILVIRNDKIGDLVTCTGVFRELKTGFPKSEITAIVSKSGEQIILKNKNIDRILVADYPPIKYKNFINYVSILKKLRNERIDIGIDLRGSIFNIILLNLLNVKYKLGYYNRYFSKFFLDYAHQKDRETKHANIQRIELLNKSLGLNSRNYKLEIATDKEDKKALLKFIKENKLKKFICIVPDASLKYKQWPLNKFDIIIKYLTKNYPKYKIILIGADFKKMNFLKQKNPNVQLPNKIIDLRLAYLLFKKSKLVITHDGGLMHLGGVANAKMIVFIPGHLAVEYYRPLSKNAIIINKNIKFIKVSEVKKEIDRLLE